MRGVKAGILICILGNLSASTLHAEPGAGDARVQRDADLLCANRWPDNFALQAACVRNAHEGAESWRSISERWKSSPAMQRALKHCIERHRNKAVVNWALVGGCARNQEDGAKELGY